MKFNQFKIKIYNDILKHYPSAQLTETSVLIDLGNKKVDISLQDIYAEFNQFKNYKEITNCTLKNITSLNGYKRETIEDRKIFPLVKLKNSVNTSEFQLIEYDMFLNLSFFYVQDLNAMLRFIPAEIIEDPNWIKNIAMNNLKKLLPELELSDKTYQIYSYYGIDYAASLMMLDEAVDKVKTKLGESFIFIVPNSDLVIFGPDSKQTCDIFKKIIQYDKLKRVSEDIYIYNNGAILYADLKKRFKVLQ